jgi:hypothetical protein
MKQSGIDASLLATDDEEFIRHMRAIHIELVNVAIAKKCHNPYVSYEISKLTSQFLQNHNLAIVEALLPRYNKELTTFPSNFILGMVHLFLAEVCHDKYEETSIVNLVSWFAGAYDKICLDFQDIKLVYGLKSN